jgi:hypothetical protein
MCDSSINDALLSVTNILALGVRNASEFSWRSQLNGSALQHLTHLSIQVLTWDALNLFPPVIKLDNIRYFSIGWALFSGLYPSGTIGSFPEWSLPNLKTLIILGFIDEPSGKYISTFLQGRGASVTELFIAGTVWAILGKDYRLNTGQTLWEWFPNLLVYGSDCHVLGDSTLPPLPQTIDQDGKVSPLSPLTLIIRGIEFIDMKDKKERTEFLTHQLLLWRVYKVVLTTTWEYLRNSDGLDPERTPQIRLSALKEAVDAVLQAGALLFDKTGSMIQSVEAKPLWDAICKAQQPS